MRAAERKRVEVLAPAGSFDSLKAAVAAGADAVYMGGSRFGARAYAQNADEAGMKEAIDYVHLHGRRLYMTVNTLFKEEELGELYAYMLPYYCQGLDGVIVQDLGALAWMRECFPGLELHASTQMTVTGPWGARLMRELGCSRVVMARELSLEELRRIHQETGVEIEAFVHGALCYCYSGQCLMSSLIGGRSGNRGRCAQPCRLPYTAVQETEEIGTGRGFRRGEERSARPQYLLNLKDMCTLELLPDLIEAGVYSLKIEGRMKSPRYTAGVVSVYRKYVDRYLAHGREGYFVEPEDRRLLLELFDRGGFSTGYYKQQNGRDMVALREKPAFRETNQELLERLDRQYVEAETTEPIRGSVLLEAGSPACLTLQMGGTEIQVSGQMVQAAQKQPVTEERIRRQLEKTGGTPFYWEALEIALRGEVFLPVQALNELRREGLEALREAVLSPWRREEPACRDWKERREGAPPAAGNGSGVALTASVESQAQLEAALGTGQLACIYLDCDEFTPEQWAEAVRRCRAAGKECWLMLPRIFRTRAELVLENSRELLLKAGFDGLLVRALEEAAWLRARLGEDAPAFAFDASVYDWNSAGTAVLAAQGPAFLTMPWELNSRELAPVLEACRERKIPGELIVYGRAPMMVSAQCVVRTVKGCSHKPELLYLKDRTGAMLPARNHCRFCYSTLLNPLPISLLGSEERIRRLGAERLRLAFTIETGEETGRILASFAAAFCGEKAVSPPFRDFTRGHFKRGVE